MRTLLYCLLVASSLVTASKPTSSQRRKVVRSFNPHRNASSTTTPLQVGNGNFAFGVDVTGLQTFGHFATQSTWGWHNFSLPTAPGQSEISDFTGLDWWTHGRLVNYNQPNPAQPLISNWLIQNPQRISLANIGLHFSDGSVTESELTENDQVLDLWSGRITSSFVYNGSLVEIQTWSDPRDSIIAIEIESNLLASGDLGLSYDFPYSNVLKFDAPFVGVWNDTTHHAASVERDHRRATFKHVLDSATTYVSTAWNSEGKISGPLAESTTKYVLQTSKSNRVKMVIAFSNTDNSDTKLPTFDQVASRSKAWWANYWSSGAFIDLSATKNANATELQRRIILSQYLMAVNGASDYPPQESGLVNNGWYGKFHLEMYMWHTLQFARWGHFDLFWRSTTNVFQGFLKSSYDRAEAQGYKGARWGKMTDTTGRSAPGQINSLLIWQQPHPMMFAEYEYRAYSNKKTLQRWDEVLTASADFMASYAWYNETTEVYDLGPPMYPVSENTNPNATINPTFELAYWRFGLDIAILWKKRQNLDVPEEWVMVRDKLAPLPIFEGTYPIYEGVPEMWVDPETYYDHPAMVGIYGLLPPPLSGPPLDLAVLHNTSAVINKLWNLEESYGWDFSMLAMNSLRLGDVDQALGYLLHPAYIFDDAGYPIGGSRVPTPYFPNSGGLLLTTAMLAAGWDGDEGAKFPKEWKASVEGFLPSM